MFIENFVKKYPQNDEIHGPERFYTSCVEKALITTVRCPAYMRVYTAEIGIVGPLTLWSLRESIDR